MRVLSSLSLDFEAADLVDLVSSFPAAVLGQLSNRIGISGAVRNDAHEVVAQVVPMVLLPANRPTSPAYLHSRDGN